MADARDDEVPELVVVGAELTALDSSSRDALEMKKVPITIVTEFGDSSDIERSLTVNQHGTSTTEWISLANGCICCSVKDSGVAAIESLIERSSGSFDYILLETTGLADPGNVAPIFWLDDGLGSSIYLDGIVTVVDAKNILKSLDEPTAEEAATENHDHEHSPVMTTAHLQISHADIILLNKSDLVSQSQLSAVTTRLSSINALARIIPTTHSHIPSEELSGTLLDLHAYSTFPSMAQSDSHPQSVRPPDFSSKGHSHLDPTISTVSLPLPPFDPQKLTFLETWLQSLLWDDDDNDEAAKKKRDYEIHRLKGLIAMTDGSWKVVQGVREIFDIVDIVPEDSISQQEQPAPPREGKLVLIGRGLDMIPGFALR